MRKLGFVPILVCGILNLSAFAWATPGSEFSFQLFQHLSQSSERKNLIFSPFAIRSALAMTALGARGRTQRQLGKMPEWSKKTSPSFKLILANRLWVDMKYPVHLPFLELSEKIMGVRPWMVDFSKAPDFLSDRVNGWVEERTSGKVQKVITPEEVDPETRMLLSSTLYFQANWALPFRRKDTQSESFKMMNGSHVNANFVNRKGGYLYYQGNDFQVIELPYVGGEMAMTLLLPDPGAKLEDLESNLKPENFDLWTSHLALREVSVSIPKFDLESKIDLTESLKDVGVVDAFSSEEADFSAMTGSRNLYLNKTTQFAHLGFTEEGTEASVETNFTPNRTLASAPVEAPAEFKANRPFFFIVRLRGAPTPLIMGKIADPSQMSASSNKK